jgi:hypothetical protein
MEQQAQSEEAAPVQAAAAHGESPPLAGAVDLATAGAAAGRGGPRARRMVLALQRTAGNVAVAGMLAGQQTPPGRLLRQPTETAIAPELLVTANPDGKGQTLEIGGHAIARFAWSDPRPSVTTSTEVSGSRIVVVAEVQGGDLDPIEGAVAPDGWTVELWERQPRGEIEERSLAAAPWRLGTFHDERTIERHAAERRRRVKSLNDARAAAAREQHRADVAKALADKRWDDAAQGLAGMSRGEMSPLLGPVDATGRVNLRTAAAALPGAKGSRIIETLEALEVLAQGEAKEKAAAHWDEAVTHHRWDDAARALAGLPDDDIAALLGELSEAQLHQLDSAAARTGTTALHGPIAQLLGPEPAAALKGKRMGWWGTSGAQEIWASDRRAQTFDTYDGAIAYAQNLGTPEAVVKEGGQFAVYDLNRALSSWFFGFTRNNVHLAGDIADVKAVSGVLAFVTKDGTVVEPKVDPDRRDLDYSAWMEVREHASADPFAGNREAFGEGLIQITDRDAFLAAFDKAMREGAYWALDRSKEEADRRSAQFRGGAMGDDADRIRHTALDLEQLDKDIGTAKVELAKAGATHGEALAGAQSSASLVNKDLAAANERNLAESKKAVDDAQAKLSSLQARREKSLAQFPMLAYIDPAEFNKLDDAGKAHALWGVSGQIMVNINTVRGWVRDETLDLWSLDNLVAATLAGLGVSDATRKGWVQERVGHAHFVKGVTDVAFAVIAIGLGIGAAFTGGATGALLAAGAAAVSTADAARLTAQYGEQQTLSSTDPNRELSLLAPDEAMAFGWVVMAWIGAGLDASAAVKAVRAIAKGADLLAIADETARASGKVGAETLVKAARGAGAREADPAALRQILESALPADVAKRIGPVPIEIVSDEEFLRAYGSRSGSAVTLIEHGRDGTLVPKVVFRESGNPLAMLEEARHVAQTVDPALKPELAKLSEANLSKWASLSDPERLALYRTKVVVEIDAQQKLIAQLEAAGDQPAFLADVKGNLEALEKRLAEIDAAIKDPSVLKSMSWWDRQQLPRLFNKSRRVRLPGFPARATASQSDRIRAILANMDPDHHAGFLEFLRDQSDLEGAIADFEPFFKARPAMKDVDRAFERLEAGEIDQSGAVVQGSRRGAATRVPDYRGVAPGQRMTKQLVKKVMKVLGKKISEADESVREAWRQAVEEVVAANPGGATAERYNKILYPKTQRKFWSLVRRDPVAKAWFVERGFWFPEESAGAPLIEAAKDFPGQEKEFSISLDHLSPKAKGANFLHALDADNLQFVTYWDNWLLALIERKLPEFAR